jgi:hypothetical protein
MAVTVRCTKGVRLSISMTEKTARTSQELARKYEAKKTGRRSSETIVNERQGNKDGEDRGFRDGHEN